MANCGCTQSGCSCVIDFPDDESIIYTGTGSLADPFIFTAANPGYVRPAGYIYLEGSGTQLNPPITDTVTTFDTEWFDTDNMVDVAGEPTRVTIQTAGFYLLGAQIRFQGSSPTIPQYAKIRKNGTTIVSQDSESDRVASLNIYVATQAFESCEVGDYFELVASSDSGPFNYFIDHAHLWAMRMGDNA